MDFIIDLPLCIGCNAIFTCVDKQTKYVRLVPCFVGEGALSAQVMAQLFFEHVVRIFGVPQVILHD